MAYTRIFLASTTNPETEESVVSLCATWETREGTATHKISTFGTPVREFLSEKEVKKSEDLQKLLPRLETKTSSYGGVFAIVGNRQEVNVNDFFAEESTEKPVTEKPLVEAPPF